MSEVCLLGHIVQFRLFNSVMVIDSFKWDCLCTVQVPCCVVVV